VSYSDTTVLAGNLYEYQVAAVNGAVMSGYSNIASVDLTGTAPAAPTGLAATLVSATQVNLAWTDNANNETSYVVQRADNGGGFATVATLSPDAVSYSDKGVTAGNDYVYRVAAANGAGTSSYSNEATASTKVPPAPLNLSATSVTATSFTLNWAWSFPQPDGFEIQVSTSSTFSSILMAFPDVNADQTSQLVSGLSRNTRYYVRIRAFSVVGNGAWATLQVRTTNR